MGHNNGGEMQFDDMFGAREPVERVQADDIDDDDEARRWQQLRASASKSDVQIALRRNALAQQAVQAVGRAVARLVTGSCAATQSLQLLGQQLSARYAVPVVIRAAAVSAAPHNFSGNNRPHRFLVCWPVRDLQVIVDPAFRRQFELGASTAPHRAFLSACVPEVFVGTVEMLTPLVSAAASAAHVSFGKLGMPLPPWRCADKLLARWLPAHPQDSSCDALLAMAGEQRARRQQSNGAAAAAGAATATAATSSVSYSRPTASSKAAAVVPQRIVVGFDLAASRRHTAAAASLESNEAPGNLLHMDTPPIDTVPAGLPLSPPAPPSLCAAAPSLPLPPPPPSSPASFAPSIAVASPSPDAIAPSPIAAAPSIAPSPIAVAPSCPLAAAAAHPPCAALSPCSTPTATPPSRPLAPTTTLPAGHQSFANLLLLAKQRQPSLQSASTVTSRSLPITSQFLAKTLTDAVAQTLKAPAGALWPPPCRKVKATRFAVQPAVVESLMPSMRLVQIGA